MAPEDSPVRIALVLLACTAFVVAWNSNSTNAQVTPPAECPSDLLYETFQGGAQGWTHFALGGETRPTDSWHLDSESPYGDDLGSMMYVSDGNGSAFGVEQSKLISPQILLPSAVPIHLAFDAFAFDEGGRCIWWFQGWDKKDVGISVDGGQSWTFLNNCYELTPPGAENLFMTEHHLFDISEFAGQAVQLVFAYDTVDADVGHTFAVDNVRIVQADSDEDLGLVADETGHGSSDS